MSIYMATREGCCMTPPRPAAFAVPPSPPILQGQVGRGCHQLLSPPPRLFLVASRAGGLWEGNQRPLPSPPQALPSLPRALPSPPRVKASPPSPFPPPLSPPPSPP